MAIRILVGRGAGMNVIRYWMVICVLVMRGVPAVSAEVPGTPSQPRTMLDPSAEPSAANIARWMQSSELLATGTFVFDYSTLSERFFRERPHKVIAEFHVGHAYGGMVREGAVVPVELSSDMLEVPGEGISAAAKREQIWADISRRRKDIDARLQALDSAIRDGRIMQQQYEVERPRVQAESDALAMESKGLSAALLPVATHAKTFYDRGGVIKPGYDYLVALRQQTADSNLARTTPGPVYSLPIVDAIFWGARRDEIVAALRTQAGTRKNR